ncbi:MAG: bifunctional DNA primase/polymerase [Sedimentisphaerales bacterium]|nr:bifunctional DNA primase/polymerase [Sedimentisphaerales bacterium]
MKDMLDAALKYASMGWKVFPLHGIVNGKCTCNNPDCNSPGKHPETGHGFKDATGDQEKLKQWFGNGSARNIGIATGEASGFDVVDIDGDAGWKSLRAGIEIFGDLPETIRQRTGKDNGYHYLFNHIDGFKSNAGGLGKNVDVRADGGYIVAAPSTHISGRTYELIGDTVLDWPQWLAGRMRNRSGGTDTGQEAGTKHAAKDAPVIEGERNASLTKIAGSMRRQGLSEAAILSALLVHNACRCSPPLSENEVRSIARSISRYEPQPDTDINTTDAGAGEMFADSFGGQFRYCHSTGKWSVYDGRRWNVATGEAEARRAVVQMARRIRDDALKMSSAQRASTEKFARQLESSGKIDSCLREARCIKPITCVMADFDSSPWLLNTPTGTVNLQTGKLLPNRPEDMITQLTKAAYDPDADCPRFKQFLSEVMLHNEKLVQYIIRLLGYCLTGDIREQILAIFYGEGSNGKSALLDTIRGLLGDYATEAAPDLLIQKYNNEHPCEVADLFGKRLVIASESEHSASLRLPLLKRITGDASLKARFMRQDYFTFTRTFKTILVTNNKPIVKEDTHAVWRRLKLIPFNATFSGSKMDSGLRLKLEAEWSGILNLLIQGCLEWQNFGLQEPEEVEIATDEYRQSQDPLADFLNECCDLKAGAVTPVSILNDSFEEWAKKVGKENDKVDSRAFNQSLRARGCRYETQYYDGRTQKVWAGVAVIR